MGEQGVLSQAETLTGLEYEQLIALAQGRVQTLMEAQGVFVGHLRRVHDCGEGWALTDWAEGFVRVEEEGKREKGKAEVEEFPIMETDRNGEVGDGD